MNPTQKKSSRRGTFFSLVNEEQVADGEITTAAGLGIKAHMAMTQKTARSVTAAAINVRGVYEWWVNVGMALVSRRARYNNGWR
ncbi:MAG: hypothetical protein CMI13_12630 [Oleibacter sp.]|nr:hypothetical protein [Thalassolituus sp.]